MSDPATRVWVLTGYRREEKKDVVAHESRVVGDQALNDAVAGLERRSDVTRITAAPA